MAWDPGEGFKGNFGKVLVIGAGAVGLVYGSLLADAGHEVAILRHDDFDETTAERGVNLFDLGSGSQREFRPRLVRDPGGEDFDLVLLAVQRQQLPGTAPALKSLTGSPHLLTLVNLPEGRSGLPTGLPTPAQLGIPGIAGRNDRDLGEVRYVRLAQRTTLLEETQAPLGRKLGLLFGTAGFPTLVLPKVDGPLAYEGLRSALLARALITHDIDPKALRKDRLAVGSLARALGEGFTALRAAGMGGGPTQLRLLHSPALLSLAPIFWRYQLGLGTADLTMAVPVRNDAEELPGLLAWVRSVAAAATTPTSHLLEFVGP